MAKKKTSVMIEEDTWKAFTVLAVKKTGSTRKTSEEVEQALKNYMTDPRVYRGPEGDSVVFLIGVGNPQARMILDRKAKEGWNTVLMRIWKK